MVIVGSVETLTVIIGKLQDEVSKLRAERDLSRSEVLRLRRLLARVMGQLRNDKDAIDRISDAIRPHEGDAED